MKALGGWRVTGRLLIENASFSAMIESTVGKVGDPHGIVGQAMPEISTIDEPPILVGKAA
jgi:hypothetical protein